MIRRPPRSTLDRSSAASDVYKRQVLSTARARTEVAMRGSGDAGPQGYTGKVDLAAVSAATAEERAPAVRRLVAEARAGVAAALAAGEGGVACAARMSDALDGIVQALHDACTRDAPAPG